MATVAQEIARAAQLILDRGLAEAKSLITPVYNVKGFGARGDGITDDRAAIQAAIDDAELGAMDSSIDVYLPPTENGYVIKGPLVMRRKTRLIGSDTLLIYDGTDAAIRVGGSPDVYAYPYVAGIRIWKRNRDRTGVGIHIAYSRFGGRFERVTIEGFGTGVLHEESYLNFFEQVAVRECTVGFDFRKDSNGVTLHNCLVNSNDQYGIKTYRANNLRIVNCELEANGNATPGNAVLIDTSTAVLVQGCYIEETGEPAILVTSTEGGTSPTVIIIGNYITGNNRKVNAIVLDRTWDATVIGNKIVRFTGAAIVIKPDSFRPMLLANSLADNGQTVEIEDTSRIGHNWWVFDQYAGTVHTDRMVLNGNVPTLGVRRQADGGETKLVQLPGGGDFRNEQNQSLLFLNRTTRQISAAVVTGPTSNRPTNPRQGEMYVDTTLGKPIWYIGSSWRDAAGNTV